MALPGFGLVLEDNGEARSLYITDSSFSRIDYAVHIWYRSVQRQLKKRRGSIHRMRRVPAQVRRRGRACRGSRPAGSSDDDGHGPHRPPARQNLSGDTTDTFTLMNRECGRRRTARIASSRNANGQVEQVRSTTTLLEEFEHDAAGRPTRASIRSSTKPAPAPCRRRSTMTARSCNARFSKAYHLVEMKWWNRHSDGTRCHLVSSSCLHAAKLAGSSFPATVIPSLRSPGAKMQCP